MSVSREIKYIEELADVLREVYYDMEQQSRFDTLYLRVKRVLSAIEDLDTVNEG